MRYVTRRGSYDKEKRRAGKGGCDPDRLNLCINLSDNRLVLKIRRGNSQKLSNITNASRKGENSTEHFTLIMKMSYVLGRRILKPYFVFDFMIKYVGNCTTAE